MLSVRFLCSALITTLMVSSFAKEQSDLRGPLRKSRASNWAVELNDPSNRSDPKTAILHFMVLNQWKNHMFLTDEVGKARAAYTNSKTRANKVAYENAKWRQGMSRSGLVSRIKLFTDQLDPRSIYRKDYSDPNNMIDLAENIKSNLDKVNELLRRRLDVMKHVPAIARRGMIHNPGDRETSDERFANSFLDRYSSELLVIYVDGLTKTTPDIILQKTFKDVLGMSAKILKKLSRSGKGRAILQGVFADFSKQTFKDPKCLESSTPVCFEALAFAKKKYHYLYRGGVPEIGQPTNGKGGSDG